MITPRSVAALLICMVAAMTGPRVGEAQSGQTDLVQQLRSDNRDLQIDALLRIRYDVAPTEVDEALQVALVAALMAQSDQYFAGLRGENTSPVANTLEGELDTFGLLVEIVSRLEDPRVIPALASAMGTGRMVRDALTRFGEESVASVSAIVESADSDPLRVMGGLHTLQDIVGDVGLAKMSATGLEMVRSSARQRLNGRQPVVVLQAAIDLGVTLGDPGLIRIVSQFADDPGAVRARGVSDPRGIEAVQATAVRSLSANRGSQR